MRVFLHLVLHTYVSMPHSAANCPDLVPFRYSSLLSQSHEYAAHNRSCFPELETGNVQGEVYFEVFLELARDFRGMALGYLIQRVAQGFSADETSCATCF
jgi:hypothetical protein